MKNLKWLILAVLIVILGVAVYLWLSSSEQPTGTPIANPSTSTSPTGEEKKTMVLKVYFPSSKFDPEVSCNRAFPVERKLDYSLDVGAKAIQELLKGPTEAEKSAGYYTSLKPGVVLQKLTITNGVAKADFNKKLDENIGGSCWVVSIRTQITETLKQFPTVKEVVISIDGRSEDILQP